ncbi:LOW QUALITY PROTEIN: CUE domain-containing protein 2-like [Physeter macrocephalus]|uniref:LOW QUALITY PROTEIN: CUE domain-containing protein 2-like n=1 Tax=Physeter macrocephalus TaxID=9755 RepID=A0A9W2X2G9_PHYMC|nr:LOW QUALITY PROTEIN: CUE domain-containing protein 2-like [Physeter catodon]
MEKAMYWFQKWEKVGQHSRGKEAPVPDYEVHYLGTLVVVVERQGIKLSPTECDASQVQLEELHHAGRVAGGARRSRRGESVEPERVVSAALLTFVQTHLPEADLSGLDEVIFYVLGVLEDLGPRGPSEENFDMEAFTEMMEAFNVPGFAHIPRGTIGEMMQKLSGQLSGARNKENLQPQNSEVQGQVSISPEPLQRFKAETMSSLTAARDTQDEASGTEEELLPAVDVLLEVFLTYSVEQAQWVLARARGDLEEAVQMLVEGKEERPPAWDGPNQDLPRRLRGPQKDELKSFILQKYMMVASAEDQKIHQPMAPKEAPKKLIQYIDNQVVSTKVERFKDVRDPEVGEVKATYVNLRPARKYRFH